jgi:hypothetical protein
MAYLLSVLFCIVDCSFSVEPAISSFHWTRLRPALLAWLASLAPPLPAA